MQKLRAISYKQSFTPYTVKTYRIAVFSLLESAIFNFAAEVSDGSSRFFYVLTFIIKILSNLLNLDTASKPVGGNFFKWLSVSTKSLFLNDFPLQNCGFGFF